MEREIIGMASLTIWSKSFPRILTHMVAPIDKFLHGRGISLTAYMDNFTDQARCRGKVIFQIHVIALVFICCGWSINLVKTILEPNWTPIYLSFPWDTLSNTIALPKDKKLPGWKLGQETPRRRENRPGEPWMFHGDSHQHYTSCLEGSPSLQESRRSGEINLKVSTSLPLV